MAPILFEFGDLEAGPSAFRDAGTAYLHTLVERMGLAPLLAPIVADALDRAGADRVVDLCAGSGGPVVGIVGALRADGRDVTAVLTDLRPARAALASRQGDGVEALLDPVDATAVPTELQGLRTIFNALHHLGDDEARAALADAVDNGQPLLAVELSERSAPAVVSAAFIPLMVWLLMPFVRPVRWSWLLLTYVLPVLPFVIAWDGLVSHLRCRSLAELEALAASVPSPGWTWEARRVPLQGPAAATVLLGLPPVGG